MIAALDRQIAREAISLTQAEVLEAKLWMAGSIGAEEALTETKATISTLAFIRDQFAASLGA